MMFIRDKQIEKIDGGWFCYSQAQGKSQKEQLTERFQLKVTISRRDDWELAVRDADAAVKQPSEKRLEDIEPKLQFYTTKLGKWSTRPSITLNCLRRSRYRSTEGPIWSSHQGIDYQSRRSVARGWNIDVGYQWSFSARRENVRIQVGRRERAGFFDGHDASQTIGGEK